MRAQEIQSPMEIDLDRDGLIEASAGTGKTYTLTRLVIRLILKKNQKLDEILVVTFTEKAAGEMKERIRAELEETVREGVFEKEVLTGEEIDRLREASFAYDRAPITTIHSFCLNTLQRYAFENGFHFDMEKTDDTELAVDALRTVVNNTLKGRYNAAYEDLIAFSDPKKGSGRKKSWEEKLIGLALKLTGGHAVLLPEAEPSPETLLKSLFEELKKILKNLETIPLKNIYKKGRVFLEQIQSTNSSILAYIPVGKPILDELSFMKNKEDPAYASMLEDLKICLKNMNDIGIHVRADIIRATATLLEKLKEERRQISFSDMLTRVEEGVRRADGLLVRSLQKQYRTALVDEFQDTDPVQWNIFRTVFLEGKNQRLFIIGDPKQAIYSFRGADIHTYYRAADRIKADMENKKAAWYRLPVNWRSAPEAVAAGNRFFREYFLPDDPEPWKKPTPFEGSRPAEKPRHALINGEGETGMFHARIDGGLSKGPAHLEAVSRIAADCRRILDSGILYKKENNPGRPVLPEDICVLTRTKRTAETVEKALLNHGIPCTIYKKEGIYSSREALHTSIMLRCLAAPENGDLSRMTMLTPFFPHSPGILLPAPEPETDAGRFLRKLGNLAEKRKWGELFRELFTACSPHLYPDKEGPRRLTNFEQIFQNLETGAIAGGMDIHRLSAHLQQLINRQAEMGEDEDLHRIESEESAVQIMTIHASKGLEFPFVYITAPLEKLKPQDDDWFIFNDRDRRVYDLLKQKDNEKRHNHEVAEEEKRLIYVAMTRAIFRTTIFYIEKSAFPKISLVTTLPPACSTADKPKQPYDPAARLEKIPLPDPLVPVPEDFQGTGYRSRRISLVSFSSLTGKNAAGITFGEQMKEDDEPEPESVIPEAEGAILLPRGPRTGNLLHGLLERIPFEAAGGTVEEFEKAVKPLVTNAYLRSRITPVRSWFTARDKKTDKNTMDKAAVEEICRILHGALNTPLETSGGETFHLKDIGPESRRHELEFHFSAAGEVADRYPEVRDEFPGGLITGFIDLVFKHGGRYYILDWKSNWLPGYDSRQLQRGMDGHRYGLQAAIYAEALRRWLNNRKEGPGMGAFDGVYYLFLRGLDETGTGVYRIAPEAPFPEPKEAACG